MRANFFVSTACYLKKDNKILFIKFNKKWGQVYAPIGGKMEAGETPTECLLREFKEETGLEFDMNSKFTKYIFEDGMFEGKFILDENAKVIDYKIRKI